MMNYFLHDQPAHQKLSVTWLQVTVTWLQLHGYNYLVTLYSCLCNCSVKYKNRFFCLFNVLYTDLMHCTVGSIYQSIRTTEHKVYLYIYD